MRSFGSPVLRWPRKPEVDAAVRRWAERLASSRPEVFLVGYFGSYARGDWGVGSDVDLVVVVEWSDEPFIRRAAGYDATDLPVPADVLVYTRSEWDTVSDRHPASTEAVWVYERPGDEPARKPTV